MSRKSMLKGSYSAVIRAHHKTHGSEMCCLIARLLFSLACLGDRRPKAQIHAASAMIREVGVDLLLLGGLGLSMGYRFPALSRLK